MYPIPESEVWVRECGLTKNSDGNFYLQGEHSAEDSGKRRQLVLCHRQNTWRR